MNFREFFDEKDHIIFDGAMGTEIYARGVPKGLCYDELNITMPEIVIEIHEAYKKAGAEVITTNTFGANRFILEEYFGIGKKVREINYYGARIARQVAKNDIFVAGSIGPISRPLDRDKRLSDDEAREIFKEQIEALLDGGVDLLVFETFSCLDELLAGIEVAREVKNDVFIIAEMSFPSNGLTLFGKNPYEVGSKLDQSTADVIGSNCGIGPQNVYEVVRKMAAVTSKELSAMPNAGLAQFVQGKFYYPYNPDYFAEYGKKLLLAGVKVLGGCCGTTPEHIKRLKEKLKGLKRGRRKLKSVKVVSHDVSLRKEEEVKSRLKKLLETGGVFLMEVDPPRGANFDSFVKKIEPYVENIHGLTVSDSPMARPRMSPISTAKLLKDRLKKEVVVHYTCRDRNIIGMQSDLLGAHALGLENFIALGGDPPSIGDYPFATGVYDLTSEGLVELMSALNHGVDFLGNPITSKTGFFIGVAMKIPDDPEKELEGVLRKIKKGAHFVVTQPVFDTEKAIRAFKFLREKGIPIVAGILPLISYKNAEYLHFEVPGIEIPHEFLQRMMGKSGEAGESEGIRIAVEILEKIFTEVNGILIMPPLGKYYLASRLVSEFFAIK